MTDGDGPTGFKRRTRLAAARDRLLDLDGAAPVERTASVAVGRADGRVLADAAVADRAVPHYARAAMDGYAVRAADTHGASERSPALLRVVDDAGAGVEPGTAVRVHTGSELPPGADAVVMVERAERSEGELAVTDAVPEGANVGPVGEDVAAGAALFDAGHRLRPADLGLLKAVGHGNGDGDGDVAVYDRPRVAVVPTGEELVQADPEPGETVETNGLTVSRFVERWGGRARYRDVVTDEPAALRAAIERDLDADAVVTTGGSSVGERDLVPDVVADLGEVFVHGVALKPGHPVALGAVEGTPVVMLPGYPVSCVVNAVQFLRPLVAQLGHLPLRDHPTTAARLARKVASEPGVRTFVRVRTERDGGDVEAVPVRAGGAGVLSSVAFADGWVTVPESREGLAAGTRVDVADWDRPL